VVPGSVSLLVVICASGLLIYSGTVKALSPKRMASTIDALGLSWNPTRVAVMLGWSEIVTGSALVVSKGDIVPGLLVVGLAVSFASAGVVAIVRGNRVPCNCIGRQDVHVVGWRQLIALPAWGLVALAVWMRPEAGSTELRLAWVAASLLVAISLTMRDLIPMYVRARPVRVGLKRS